ncbi:MAG: hypothetical protein ACPG4K_14090 [Haloferula sp.]
MNTKPDDELLALWVEDELDVTIHTEVDAWASGQAEWIEHRELARKTKVLLGGNLSPDQDLPNGEFFNARIRREIEVREAAPAVEPPPSKSIMAWLVPLTAAASLVLGIWIGRGGPQSEVVPPPVAELTPVLYTPQKGVQAELLKSEEATVVVLAGVDAIPDSWEIPATAMRETEPRPMASAEK